MKVRNASLLFFQWFMAFLFYTSRSSAIYDSRYFADNAPIRYLSSSRVICWEHWVFEPINWLAQEIVSKMTYKWVSVFLRHHKSRSHRVPRSWFTKKMSLQLSSKQSIVDVWIAQLDRKSVSSVPLSPTVYNTMYGTTPCCCMKLLCNLM